MATSGDVDLTIADNGAGAVSVPAATVQVVLGCCSSGTVTTATSKAVLATRQPATLQSTYGYGPGVEAAAMIPQAGGSVLFCRVLTTTAGAVVAGAAAVNIVSSTNANPIVVTATAHGFLSGQVVTIAGHTTNTAAVGTWKVTVLTADTFSIPVAGVGIGGATGTATWTGAIQSGTGTSANTFTGAAAYDEFYIVLTCVKGCTFGTTGGTFTVDLGAGRGLNLPAIALGTALTYVIPQTNVTAVFETGKTWVAGDTVRCRTTAPIWNIAGVQDALAGLRASPYASAGWGSMHLVGKISAADAATLQTTIEGFTDYKLYDRIMCDSRDASPPTAWGGTGETDSAFKTSVLTDYAATEARRVGVAVGHYNMRSAFPNSVAGLPIFRRSLGWAWAARVVEMVAKLGAQPADHEGWCRLRQLSQIILDPVNDPGDGFLYCDEGQGFVFDGLGQGGVGRLTAARQRPNLPGWFISNPLTLAPAGSDFQLMPYCRVIDIASDALQDAATPYVNERIKRNPNKTIDERAASGLESVLEAALDVALAGQISARRVVVDRDWNIVDNASVKITGTIEGDSFALKIILTLGFGSVEA